MCTRGARGRRAARACPFISRAVHKNDAAREAVRLPACAFVCDYSPPAVLRARASHSFRYARPLLRAALRRKRQVAGAPAGHARGPLPLARAAQNTTWVRAFTLRGAGCAGAALRALFLARGSQRPKPRSARVPHHRVQAHSTQGARAARLSRLDFEVCSLPVPQARAHRARVRLARWLACAPPTADRFTSSLRAQAPTRRPLKGARETSDQGTSLRCVSLPALLPRAHRARSFLPVVLARGPPTATDRFTRPTARAGLLSPSAQL